MKLYAISREGRPTHLADLHLIEPRGFFLVPAISEMKEALYTDLPYFLEDLRPSGFLGRLLPRLHPDLGAPMDILAWSADDCLRYWSTRGWDLIGNFLLGERALQRYLEWHQKIHIGDQRSPVLPESYPHLARRVLEQGDAGSSVGGEQPKFLLEATSSSPASLVKFSPPTQDAIGRRVADLLICEHLCHEVLSAHDLSSAKSEILEIENQVFLRVERFDRIGVAGRRGLISLTAVSLKFGGSLESWSKISQALLHARKISEGIRSRIEMFELFGHLIANTDMHSGNLSFFLDERLELDGLAPVYDMLPMMYSPRQYQLIDRKFEPKLPLPREAKAWKEAAVLAENFWERASTDLRISPDFREIASKNLATLRKQIELAAALF